MPSERIRDLRYTHERLGTLADLIKVHVDPEHLTDGWADIQHSIVRARAKVGEMLDREEGRK